MSEPKFKDLGFFLDSHLARTFNSLAFEERAGIASIFLDCNLSVFGHIRLTLNAIQAFIADKIGLTFSDPPHKLGKEYRCCSLSESRALQ